MASTQTATPASITAGDTATWTLAVSDYSAADGWVMSYSFRSGAGAIDFSSTASGANHLFALAASDTANWFAGIYSGVGYVEKAGERFTVWRGMMEVLPNLSLESADFEPRSQAKQILDFIEASFKKIAQKQVVSSSVAGVSLNFRTMDELIRARDYWAAIYQRELDRAQGRGRQNYFTKFVNA